MCLYLISLSFPLSEYAKILPRSFYLIINCNINHIQYDIPENINQFYGNLVYGTENQ